MLPYLGIDQRISIHRLFLFLFGLRWLFLFFAFYIKRARDSSDDIIDEKQFEENANQNNEEIEDDNQKEKELEEKEKKIFQCIQIN
jgi:hypothetical protein